MRRLLHDLFSLLVHAKFIIFNDSLVLMLADHNIDIMAYLRSTLRLHFSLIDPRLRWTLNLPYLLLLSVFYLGEVFRRLKILNFVVVDSLHLDWLRPVSYTHLTLPTTPYV